VRCFRLISVILAALYPLGVSAQQVVPAAGVPVEWSSNLDVQAVAGGGGVAGLDPGQALYVEPADSPGPPNPRNALDFDTNLEAGDEPDSQVDALANGRDAQFDEVVANTAELFLSFRPDPPGPAAPAVFREFPSGGSQAVWAKPHLNNPNQGALAIENVDALELWGPLGTNDAIFYSLNGDVTGTSVFVLVGGVAQPYISQAQINATVTVLFGFPPPGVDVDALMVKDADANNAWNAGDAILFSLRATTGIDGGEIIYWPCCAAPSVFLNHGGHVWNTAFNVSAAFFLPVGTEDVDALEAAPPGQVVAPAVAIPILGVAGAALLGGGLLTVAALRLRARRRSARPLPSRSDPG
jgi:hypothetical protein